MRVRLFHIGRYQVELDLTDQPHRPGGEADEIASGHLNAVDARIMQPKQQRWSLRALFMRWGKSAGQCRVIETLAGRSACTGEHALLAPRRGQHAKPRDEAAAKRAWQGSGPA
jgi:hypothetical protein